MLKPISLLVSALMLTSTTLAPAKADADKMVTILTMMEPDKPAVVVMVDVPHSKITLRGGTITHDGAKNALTQTTIIKGNIEVISTDKEGKPTSYKVKDGVAILTRTLVKASAAPTSKAVKKSKA